MQISLDGRLYLSHRLAWLYAFGEWPPDQIDHVNGVREDNRLCNLRKASNAENMQNQRRAKPGNKSGLLGARFNRRDGRWRSDITTSGKRVFLGQFDTAQEAHRAYLAAKAEAHPFSTILSTDSAK